MINAFHTDNMYVRFSGVKPLYLICAVIFHIIVSLYIILSPTEFGIVRTLRML